MDGPARPLSPFLIYRWGVTNGLSILHRITGVFLTFGILVLSWWLMALASSAESYAGAASFFGSPWFKLPLVGWAFCFFYHLANGVRHLFWDAGYGFESAGIKLGGMAVVLFAVVTTAIYAMVGIL